MSLRDRIDKIKRRYEARKAEIQELKTIISDQKIKLDDLKKAKKQFREARVLLKKARERRWWDALEGGLQEYTRSLDELTELRSLEELTPDEVAALKKALEALDGPLTNLWRSLVPAGLGAIAAATMMLGTDPQKLGAMKIAAGVAGWLVPLAVGVKNVVGQIDEHVKGKISLVALVHAELGGSGARADAGAFLTTFGPAAIDPVRRGADILDDWKKRRELREERRKQLRELERQNAEILAAAARVRKRAGDVARLGETLLELEQTGKTILHRET